MALRCVIRAFVLSGVRLHREGLAALVDRTAEVCVTGTGATVEEAVQGGPYDIAIVDAGTRTAAAEVRLLAQRVGVPIVAFSVPTDEGHVIALAEAGVLGFVEREASLDELVMAVRSAARGEARFPPTIATALLRRIRSPAPPPIPANGFASLTVRERQIVEIIAEGLTNKEIAARLSIEVATVKNHVHNILEKLQVSRRTEAVARLRLVGAGAPAHPPQDAEPAVHVVVGSRTA